MYEASKALLGYQNPKLFGCKGGECVCCLNALSVDIICVATLAGITGLLIFAMGLCGPISYPMGNEEKK